MNYHNIYMQRAIELAQLAQGYTGDNPMVGAVLVHEGRIIGEGYHQRWGEAHAEVMAVHSVREENKHLLPHSTLYVSLEPCSHHGKTPPCANLIIRSGIPRVVVAQLDPYPEVSGRGIRRLQEAGIEVITGCMELEARQLNKGFNTRYLYQRPYVLLKWAESADGYIDALRNIGEGVPIIFSSSYRQRIVHRCRRNYQAILIGARTARQDNPSLTNRYWGTKQPIRIVLDWDLSLPANLTLFTDELSATWVIYDEARVQAIPQAQGHIRYLPLRSPARERAKALLELLHSEGIHSLFVEGGAKTLQMFIDEALYDEIRCERSPIRLSQGVAAPRYKGL